jgi:hypothetical protein
VARLRVFGLRIEHHLQFRERSPVGPLTRVQQPNRRHEALPFERVDVHEAGHGVDRFDLTQRPGDPVRGDDRIGIG